MPPLALPNGQIYGASGWKAQCTRACCALRRGTHVSYNLLLGFSAGAASRTDRTQVGNLRVDSCTVDDSSECPRLLPYIPPYIPLTWTVS